MTNESKYYLRYIMSTVVNLFVGGGIIQTFFAEIGFSTRQIGGYTALINIIQVAVMILSIFFADTTRNVKGAMALLSLPPALFCGAMLLPCIDRGMNIGTVYWLAMVLCAVNNLFAGFSNILTFRMLYIITDPADFSRLESNGTIICGAVSIAASGTISFLASRFDYRLLMAVGFIVSIIFSVGCALALNSLHPREGFSPPPAPPFRPKVLFRHDFRFFYIPNLLRGFGNGLMGMMTVVCLRQITTETSVVSGLAAIGSVAMVTGAWLFRTLRKRNIPTATLYAACSAVMCLLLPLTVAGRSALLFCGLYFIIHCAYASNNLAGALYPSEYVPYEDIGTYTSVRLILMTAGQAIASYAVPYLLEAIPAALMLALGGAAQLCSGLLFLYYDRRWAHPLKAAA